MKKIILTSFLLFTLILSNLMGVIAIEYDSFDFTVYDNEKYNLLTGIREDADTYSITNKILLYSNLIDNEVTFSNDDFHHVLFFNEYNAYLGYVNTDKSDLRLSTWIDGDVAIDGTLVIPDGVDKIALMNYNYDDVRDNIIYENNDIDEIAWETLSYRDIFENTDLIINGDFENTTIEYRNTRNLFDIDALVDNFEYDITILDVDSFKVYVVGDVGEYIITDGITFETSAQYTLTYTTWVDIVLNLNRVYVFYTDGTSDPLTTSTTTPTEIIFTTDAGKTVERISLFDFSDTVDDFVYYDNLQIEQGTSSTDYISFLEPYDSPIGWSIGSGIDLEVLNGELHVTTYGSVSSATSYQIYQNNLFPAEFNTVYHSAAVTHVADEQSFRIFYPSNNIVITSTTTQYNIIAPVGFGGFGNRLGFGTLNAVGSYIIDNVELYDLTDIGFITMPTTEEFETMQLYYDTYINAVAEISYNDIFENNLIINGDFSDSDISMFQGGNARSTIYISNGKLHSRSNGTSEYPYIKYLDTRNMANKYYISLEIKLYGGIVDRIHLSRPYNIESDSTNTDILNPSLEVTYTLHGIVEDTWETYDDILNINTTYTDINNDGYITEVDNIRVFDLTSTFGYVEDDVTTEWIELQYETWLDPFEDEYTNYYPAANLIVLDIDYSYDDTPPADLDAITSIDEGLLKMGVITEELQVFLAFVIMIIVAIFIGLATHNKSFIILAETVLIIIFTMLGWFSFWILLLIALIFTLLILRNGLKGGNEQ